MRTSPPWLGWLRRAAAFAVALLCVVPFHRLLSPERNGPAGADALARAEAAWSTTLWGAAIVALVGLGGALWARGRGRAVAAPFGGLEGLAARRTLQVALAAGGLAALLSALVAVGVYDRLLVSVDEMAQVIHARYLASGLLAGPLPAGAEAAWAIPNMLVTERGWASQYPPGHPLVWAGFLLAGLRWAPSPILLAVTVGFFAASIDRLLPEEHRAQGRVAVLLMAISPFSVLLAAASPSHLTAGAAGMVALYAALRAAQGGRAWAAMAGAAVGVMVLARPWTGLVLGPVLTLGVWLEHGGASLAARRIVPWIAGGLPCAALLFGFDRALFGSPLLLGYEALYGPAHGLGLHSDPWSYPYGLREALAYSASDVVQLGAALLESPVSVVLVGAAYLALAGTLPRGVAVIAAWALLPVAANALYWFHAPRMLFEASPAWMLLAVLGVAHAFARAGPMARAGIVTATAGALLVAVPLGISRVRAERWNDETLTRIAMPTDAGDALVFVHASWDERIASMLQAAGMRSDSIQPILRRNDTCALHLYAVGRLEQSAGASHPPIDLEQTSAPPARAVPVELAGGTRIWRDETSAWQGTCGREAAADRFGSVALAPLLWQGDLPGIESDRPMFVRDLGPERNRAVLRAYPDRRAFVFSYDAPGRPPMLIPYEEAMVLLWGTEAQPPI